MNNPLADEPFSYVANKNGTVFISFNNKIIKTLSKDTAAKFLADIADAGETEAQLIMAKITGNFKRGNEKQHAKSSGTRQKNLTQ